MELVASGELHVELEQEAVELRFGQRIGPLHLEGFWVASTRKGSRACGRLGHGDALLLHRLEQRRLGLGRGAVDLVGEHHVGEDRAGAELELACAVLALTDHRGADDVGGHQVRGELDAREVQLERLAQGPNQHRLAQPGHALEQPMAAGEQADQHPDHRVLLPHDDLAHLVHQPLAVGLEALDLHCRVDAAGSLARYHSLAPPSVS